jgi:crotonobetainyl-CoA:carnitine CoA-transferase CaiB-like acyl-CoA transferase
MPAPRFRPSTDFAFTATPAIDASAGGPLHGLRVVELASEAGAFGGKLLADYGADVVLVEPPGGHYTRHFEPFVDDADDVNASLWFWHYNTSKRGVCLDLSDTTDSATFARLVDLADIVLESEPVGRLAALGLDGPTMRLTRDRLIWVSLTPFGRSNSRSHEQAVDLTVLSGGGLVWSSGYDDHSRAPVHAGGNQGYQTAALWAAIASLTAVQARNRTGKGDLVDVSMHAAANVTTERGSHEWLVAHATVQRQTGRHAATQPTPPTIVTARDGRDIHTGVPPHSVRGITSIVEWLEELGLTEVQFPDIVLLRLGVELGGIDLTTLESDALTGEIFRACREALVFIALQLDSYEFFVEGQRRDLAVGIVYSPEEIMTDPHIAERGFPTEVHHHSLDRTVVYPGAPARFTKSPWRIRRPAPAVAQDQHLIPTLWQSEMPL